MTKYDNRKIRFAIAGCGHIGLRHAEMITRHHEAELIALCDIRNKEEINLKDYSDVPFYNSIDEMLDGTSGIDVVNIWLK